MAGVSWHKGKYAWSTASGHLEGLVFPLADGYFRGEVLDAARNGFVVWRHEYRELNDAKRDIGGRVEGRIPTGQARTRAAGSGSIKARWQEVRRLERGGHPLKHPRAYVFRGGRTRGRG